MTTLAFTQDANGKNSYGLPFSDFTRTTTLSANTEQTLTVPSTNIGGYLAVFSYEIGKTVYVGIGSTPVTIPGASFADTNGEGNKASAAIPAGSTLRFITDSVSAQVGVVLYELA